ncbi:beta-1,4-N-acetylglucosamine oligosaccharide 3-O-carbamoyltransferase NolO [Asanoa ferruginea]|uniref:Beta-1,4-N-acetylglucosamine oligosaccharide 3-O-carbamoyltransferase NolO n=1 Tax=Asanoa ferruginea TaxID=53367 RepID=A0A3D9ZWU3_9ACTN|nr:carbamoyltransferase C-terminal domain-containing protein [Asanoa ferruginea]REG01013.1 beta-1,4-N-acetylglucosamine oligosaccharide 3-O-carbamoyltransferase NolO [Asanoa ferruginea]GIF47613.1 nodulation protein NolNO [Asanoa ferruginea]
MNVLGLTGGPHTLLDDYRTVPHLDGYWHDAAAALIVDGVLRSAHEEERHTRVKNTSVFPANSVAACMSDAGIAADGLDAVAVYFTEAYWRRYLNLVRHYVPDFAFLDPRALIRQRLREVLGDEVCAPLHFVDHHLCHGYSALAYSGYQDCLVLTLDGAGDEEAGRLVRVRDRRQETLHTVSLDNSLGGLYLHVTKHLGYGQFDEYKVMGLASYGDPNQLADDLGMVRLKEAGRFEVEWSFVDKLESVLPARRRHEPITQDHADLAACVQRALEGAVLHLLQWHCAEDGSDRLCFAGGVAHNSTLNGVIEASGLVRSLFVPPGAHDGGCSIGAATATYLRAHPRSRSTRMASAYLGTAIPKATADELVPKSLHRFLSLVDLTTLDNPVASLAARLAAGEVIGVARGRAEFGPRALGNRSILADPRQAAMRDRINSMIKSREGYRPFAPVVAAEDASRYFVLNGAVEDYSFMSSRVTVRNEFRHALAAVTHVDGSARLQTVSRDQNPWLWRLLHAFKRHSGLPILLNTSLNVSAEPIVDSVEDALLCLLTSGLSGLVLGELAVTPTRQFAVEDFEWVPMPGVRLLAQWAPAQAKAAWALEKTGPRRFTSAISGEVASLLLQHLEPMPFDDGVAAEIEQLWRTRYVRPVM